MTVRLVFVFLALIVLASLGLGVFLIADDGLPGGSRTTIAVETGGDLRGGGSGSDPGVAGELAGSAAPAEEVADEIVLGEIGGKVIDLRDRPVASAIVRLWPMPAEDEVPEELRPGDAVAEVECAPDGTFLFTELTPGSYWVFAECRRLTMLPVGGHPVSTGLLEFTIVMQAEASLSGRVVTTQGLPVEGATAFVSLGASGLGRQQTSMSEEDGSFRIESIAAGIYVVGAVHPDHGSFRELRRLAIGEHLGDLQFVLSPGVAIAGTVRNQFDELVVGASVEFAQTRPDYSLPQLRLPALKTDEEGEFLLRGLDEGTYEVQCSHPDHLPADPVLTRAGSVDDELQLRLLLAATITGRVVDEEDEPIYQATVTLTGEQGLAADPAKTDGDGFYEFGGLTGGVYTIQADHPDTIRGDPLDIEVELGQTVVAPTIVLVEGGEIAGRILGSRQLGVVGAEVLAAGISPELLATFAYPPTFAEVLALGSGEIVSAKTTGGGRFRIKGLFTDLVYALGATHTRYLPKRDDPGVYPVGSEGVELQLESGAMLYGTVKSEDGGPVSGARITVSLEPAEGPRIHRTTYSDTRGAYRMLALPVGEGEVRAAADGYMKMAPPVFLAIGASLGNVPQDLILTPDPDGTIQGRIITGGNMDPVLGAIVAAVPSRDEDQARFHTIRARSDDEGLFTLESAGDIPYIVGARAKDYVLTGLPSEARAGQYVILHLTRVGTFTGTVVDELGLPIPAFQVRIGSEVASFQDPAGSFEMPMPPGLVHGMGTLWIEVTALGFAPGLTTLQGWRPFRDNPLGNIQLLRLLTVQGVVHGQEREPIPGARVEVYSTNDYRIVESAMRQEVMYRRYMERYAPDQSTEPPAPLQVASSDERGRFQLGGIEPAVSYTVLISHPEFESYSQSVRFPKGDDPTLDVTLEHVASIRGLVRFQSGHPMPGVIVRVHPTRGGGPWSREDTKRLTFDTMTAEDGTFFLGPLEPGRFLVEVHHPRDDFLLFEREVTLRKKEQVELEF